ncbi:unnamed protein product [Hermetia illucens]|uniref:Uncharacterized protein n=2 Tax=Hermetia illucens TaxID=343691 RepID=A0A7R8UPN3_HERIL|nr:unnamed protein product [Hermetia illucens]
MVKVVECFSMTIVGCVRDTEEWKAAKAVVACVEERGFGYLPVCIMERVSRIRRIFQCVTKISQESNPFKHCKGL